MNILKTILAIVIFAFCSVEFVLAEEPSPEQQEMMKKMQEAGKPSAKHKKLNSLVGKWKAKSSWRMSPEGPAQESEASVDREWVLNGLFVKEHYQDKNPQNPFEGMGMMGFDKVADEFTYSWFDTMTSSTWKSSGQFDDAGKQITFRGSGYCPITEGEKKTHSQIEIVSNDKHIFRMYDTAPDGKEFTMLEIEYVRG